MVDRGWPSRGASRCGPRLSPRRSLTIRAICSADRAPAAHGQPHDATAGIGTPTARKSGEHVEANERIAEVGRRRSPAGTPGPGPCQKAGWASRQTRAAGHRRARERNRVGGPSRRTDASSAGGRNQYCRPPGFALRPRSQTIRRGSLRKPTEFGYKLALADTPEGFVIAHDVHIGAPPDTDTPEPVLRKAKAMGMHIRTVIADRGFGNEMAD